MKAVCAMIKNEHRHLKEWIDYNLSIGFDAIHLYEDVNSLSHKDITSQYSNVFLHDFAEVPHDKTDIRSYKQTDTINYFVSKYDYEWVAIIDPDEFIRFDEGYDLERLTNEFSYANGIYLFWRMIGSCGNIYPVKSLQDELKYDGVDRSFHMIKWSVKTLLHASKCKTMRNIHKCICGVHTNGNNAVHSRFYHKAWIDHYFTKSWEEWLERFESRGDVVEGNRQIGEYFKINPDDKEKCIEHYLNTRGEIVNVHLKGRMCNQLFIISAALKQFPDKLLFFSDKKVDPYALKLLEYNNIKFTYWNDSFGTSEINDYCQDYSLHDEKLLHEKIKLPPIEKKYDFVIVIRREDYLSEKNINLYYVLTKEYIERMYKKYYKGGTVAIVSTLDGIEWAKEQNFSFNFESVYENPLICLSTIANAKTIICSNSSFSVMGCMLNQNEDKICVIATPYDKISIEHDKIIPDYFKKEKLYLE